MKINEIFFSLQGEGKWTGLPNIFIRTSGCNLRCSFCDTKYAYEDGKEMSLDEILNEISKYSCKKICLTGGEPLWQNEIILLIDQLLKRDYEICLETNGSINIQELSKKNSLIISLDIKCPSSNMNDKNNLRNINYLRLNDQIKFIIKDITSKNIALNLSKKCLQYSTNPKALTIRGEKSLEPLNSK